MATITAKDVQALRKKTGAGILDCRHALEEAEGDMDQAERILREKGIISASKRQHRERTEGAVAVVVHGGHAPTGAIVMLECETDFVAKSAEFVSLVEELANELALNGEKGLAECADRIENLKFISKENIALGQTVRFEASESAIIGSYRHLQNGRGVNAVLVETSEPTRRWLTTSLSTSRSPVRSTYGVRMCLPSRSTTCARPRRRLYATRANRPRSGQDRRGSAPGLVQRARPARPTLCARRAVHDRAAARRCAAASFCSSRRRLVSGEARHL